MQSELMNQKQWCFLLGDLRAAEWAVRIDLGLSPQTLGKKFLAIHRYLIRNMGRERPGPFKGIDRGFLVTVVRKWVDLYRHTLGALAHRYPNEDGSNELDLADTNWSRCLHISYEGIVEGMSYASRYAEFWAGMSLRNEECFGSFDERKAFIGSEAYWRFWELGNAKKLTVVDALGNSATPFDMIRSVARAPDDASIARVFREQAWTVQNLHSDAQAALRAYGEDGAPTLDGPWPLSAALGSGAM